ncbi:MAG: RidA family protein [Pigmentiphaga sp.]|nr:RidA family protein [Pigmentiphaga sp.]
MNTTQAVPAPPGKFSRMYPITIGDSRLLFISGLVASGETPQGVGPQTERVFERIRLLLAEANAELKHIVKLTVILANMDDYAEYNAVRNRVFAESGMPPASTAFEGRLVAPEYLIEIEAIAIAPSV